MNFMHKMIVIFLFGLFMGAGCARGQVNSPVTPPNQEPMVSTDADASLPNAPMITEVRIGDGLNKDTFSLARETKIFDRSVGVAIVGKVKNLIPGSSIFAQLSTVDKSMIKMQNWNFDDSNPARKEAGPGEERFYFNFPKTRPFPSGNYFLLLELSQPDLSNGKITKIREELFQLEAQ